MSETSRPPGLDQIAEGGLKLAGRIALGLATLPLIGLALAAGARNSGASGPSEPPSPEPPTPEPPPVENGPTVAEEAKGPRRAEIEIALEKLAEASIGRSGPAKPKGRPRPVVKAAERRSRETPRPAGAHPDNPR